MLHANVPAIICVFICHFKDWSYCCNGHTASVMLHVLWCVHQHILWHEQKCFSVFLIARGFVLTNIISEFLLSVLDQFPSTFQSCKAKIVFTGLIMEMNPSVNKHVLSKVPKLIKGWRLPALNLFSKRLTFWLEETNTSTTSVRQLTQFLVPFFYSWQFATSSCQIAVFLFFFFFACAQSAVKRAGARLLLVTCSVGFFCWDSN